MEINDVFFAAERKMSCFENIVIGAKEKFQTASVFAIHFALNFVMCLSDFLAFKD